MFANSITFVDAETNETTDILVKVENPYIPPRGESVELSNGVFTVESIVCKYAMHPNGPNGWVSAEITVRVKKA